GRWRAERQGWADRTGATTTGDRAKALERAPDKRRHAEEGAHHGDDRLPEQVASGRNDLGLPWAGGGRRRRCIGSGVEDVHQQLGRLDAVGHAVVDLGDEADVVVLEALDDPDLPQRVAAVELVTG